MKIYNLPENCDASGSKMEKCYKSNDAHNLNCYSMRRLGGERSKKNKNLHKKHKKQKVSHKKRKISHKKRKISLKKRKIPLKKHKVSLKKHRKSASIKTLTSKKNRIFLEDLGLKVKE